MKKLWLTIIFLLSALPQVFPAVEHEIWDSLLKAHVKNGLVDYASFSSDREKLNRYLDSLDQMSVDSFADESREERMAAWINAYNATTISLVLSRYPVSSIESVPGFWDGKNVRIAGMRYSLREVRERVIRGGFRDEHSVLALVSGTKSSGPLRAEAYTGSKLLEQLDDQVSQFLDDERYNQIRPGKKKLFLSPILKEIGPDLILGYGRAEKDSKFSAEEIAILGFVRIHTYEPEVKKWIEGRRYKVYYMAVDTSLNDAGRSA